MRITLLVLSLLFAVAARSKQLEYESLEYRRAVDPGKVILFIGQNLVSTPGYAASGYFSTPSCVNAYLAFYQLNRSFLSVYGVLVQDIDCDLVDSDVDWGAGPTNAHDLAVRYSGSALSMGLNITEGDGHRS